MNREIIFRGKAFGTREWVYGNLRRREDGGNFIETIDAKHCFPVLPETIGQFTGLYDKNGTKIYEGDIIKGRKEFEHLVRYNNDRAQFTATLLEYVGDIMERSWEGTCEQRWIDEFNKEVIGNIHDKCY